MANAGLCPFLEMWRRIVWQSHIHLGRNHSRGDRNHRGGVRVLEYQGFIFSCVRGVPSRRRRIFSTTPASSRPVVSPRAAPVVTISFNRRRMIFPLEVLGRASVK